MVDRFSGWARERGPIAVTFAGLAVLGGAAGSAAPGRDLGALAAALGKAAGGARVSPEDVRWQPSEGALADVVRGRWALFLAREPGEDTRDVWRARVRVSPDGAAIDVRSAYDLTSTPIGDDHELVVRDDHAAFVTRAYGQEQSTTVLSLAGEGSQNKTASTADRLMAAVTNLQKSGSTEGLGRFDVTLESPARAVGLSLGPSALDLSLFGLAGGFPHEGPGGDARGSHTSVDLATGDLTPALPMVHTDASMHLPKRFSHWVVDTLRAVPWIGPAPVAWVEDQALALRDAYRRVTFQAGHDPTDVVATADPPPPPLDTSQASVDEAHWPPARIPTMWKSPEPKEGEWFVPDVPWLRHVPGVAADAPSPFYQTFVRPDEDRPYARVLLVAMDLRQLDLQMEAGVEDPEPLTGPHGTGRIPREPAVYRRVAAAFNGAFKTEHGHYGMMVKKRVLLPPVPGSATVMVLDDGRVGFGTWGTDKNVGGIVGVADDEIDSFRQNLDPLIDHGQLNPTGRNLWGFTLPGKGAQTERTGLCVTTSGHLLYAWGDDLSATSLAKAMQMGGCDYAMHLDMNPYHTGFLFLSVDDLTGRKYKSQLLTPAMSIPTDRYIQYAPKDFFYVMVHDPTPPPVPAGEDGAAVAWTADDGAQPPPRWMPGVWTAQVAAPEGAVQLLDVEPGRATWRVRAGTKDAPAAAPLRELGGDEARRVLLAVGAGVAHERRPLGLATDGRLVVPVRGGPDSGVLLVDGDGQLQMAKADAAPALGPHDDLVELPLVLWDGKSTALPAMAGPPSPRAALGQTPSGRWIVARGVLASAAPLARALARAGCVRAVLLDRGTHAAGFLDRAGTADPPRARYDESVLYALGSPLHPSGFRFDASTPVPAAKASR
ncbi:MAG TPA: hypothetical protein VK762_31040 [Polyangiaceae bacterium]|nr:hypothetical protein [Polyangiaceae bacterium]